MSDGWVVICKKDDVDPDSAKTFYVDEHRLCVVNDGIDYFVVDDLCTHGKAYLSEGYCDTEDCVLECPLHGGLFDYRDGSPQGCPAEKPVRSYAVRLENDRVLIQL